MFFFVGSESQYMRLPEDEPKLRQHFSNYRVEIVNGAEHIVHQTHPLQVVKLISEWHDSL